MNDRRSSEKSPAAEDAAAEIVSLRDKQKELTRERLVATAINLFVQKGYESTSVSKIAQKAGTTPTTFYRYFSGKADIARALQDHINLDVKKTLDDFDDMPSHSHEDMRHWMDQYGEMWERMHVMCDAFWGATKSDRDLAAELVPITYEMASSMAVACDIPEGEEREQFLLRFVLMFLLMDRLFYLVEIQQHNETATRMIDEFSNIFRDALFGGTSRD